MDKQYKFHFGDKQFVKYLKLLIIGALLVVEILVCAQYATLYLATGTVWKMVSVVVCCAAIALLEIFNSFLIRKLVLKIFFYALDSVLLLFICIITGNAYLSTLYCLVLTQFYISVEDMRLKTGLFIVSCGAFVVSFVCGWVTVNKGASLYESIVRILGDCVFGVFILVLHFIITNFLLKFYEQNVQLRLALKEAEENRERLENAQTRLSETAVFEERNRIAKDIHDNAGHSMTTVIMQTEAAKLLIDENPEEAKNRIISANMQAKNALEQMRESVHLLAGRKQSNSLSEGIEEIIAQTIDGTDLKIRTDLEDVQVDDELYRFFCNSVKECLANGIRHGKATAFYIELKNTLSNVSLLISDNGVGAAGGITEGFGLKSMREGAEALGGQCLLSSEADEGFEVEIILPYNKSGENKND